MAITTRLLTGFEHGFIAAAAAVGGSGSTGLINALTLPANWSASTTNPRNGSYCAHLVAPASTVTNLGLRFPPNSTFVARFGVKVSSRPSSGKVMLAAAGDSGGESFRVGISSAGVLECGFGTTLVTGSTIDTTNWHLIEVQADAAAQTVDWKVDGVLQTRAAAAVASFIGEFTFGVLSAGAAAQAFTADYDDFICGNYSVAATDWYGDGKVLAQRAGVDGTHATVTSLSFGDAGTALSGTVTTANTMVDDAPGTGGWTATRSTTDNIALRVATVGAYLEIGPAPTAEAGQANGVQALMSYSAPGTQANAAACDVRNTAGVAQSLIGTTGAAGSCNQWNLTANAFRSNTIPRPVAGWTAAEVNLVRFRFGGCSAPDINPVPTVQAMMLEVDWPIAAPLVVTPVKPRVIRQAVNRAAVI